MTSSTRLSKLLRSYQVYLMDANAAQFVAAVASQYSMGTLTRLATSQELLTKRASALALGFVGDMSVVPVLGRLLSDMDRKVRMVADDALKAVWSRAGSPRQRQQMERLNRLMQCNQFEHAIEVADDLLAVGLELPEAYCQRGFAKFYLENPHGALEDCQRALDVCQYHYVSSVGIGHCHMEIGEPLMALDAFRNALRIYPDIESVRLQVARLERAFQEPS